MTQTPTARSIHIDYDEQRAAYWRLVSRNGSGDARPILEARPNQPMRYVTAFAQRQQLPAQRLDPADIQQVILGWSREDKTWHLGLLLNGALADQRGSRWCGLAQWYAPDGLAHQEAAHAAGQALARTLDRPFRLIPSEVRTTADRSGPSTADLPPLPLDLDRWTLERQDGTLVLRRSRAWLTAMLLRTAWYFGWFVVFTMLSVATLTVDLALPNSGLLLPNPQLLPYLGLLVAVVILGLALNTVRQMLTIPDSFVADSARSQLTARIGPRTRWTLDTDTIQAVYVTQVMRQSRRKRVIDHGELNLQMRDHDAHFRRLMVCETEQEREADLNTRPLDYVMPMKHAETPLQAAGVYLARELGGLPCIDDQRVP